MDEAKRMREALRSAVVLSTDNNPPAEEINQKQQRQMAAQKRQALAELTRPWRKELEKIDTELQQLSLERDSLQAKASDPAKISDRAEWGRRCKAVEDRIGLLEERWLDLSEKIETAETARP
jgi:ATP-binding cassette subfamily F protein 3